MVYKNAYVRSSAIFTESLSGDGVSSQILVGITADGEASWCKDELWKLLEDHVVAV
jgi:hypothetical protein